MKSHLRIFRPAEAGVEPRGAGTDAAPSLLFALRRSRRRRRADVVDVLLAVLLLALALVAGERASGQQLCAVVPETGGTVCLDASCVTRVRVGADVLTGTLVAPDLVVTNWHAFRSYSSPLTVEVAGEIIDARLIATDYENDLAAVELVRAARVPPIEIAVGNELPTGRLYVCCHGGRLTSGVAGGVVHPTSADNPHVALAIDGAMTQGGDSGAPVLNTSYKFVGVVWGNLGGGQAYGCCGQPLRRFLDRILPGRPGVLIARAQDPPPQPQRVVEPMLRTPRPAAPAPPPAAAPPRHNPAIWPPINRTNTPGVPATFAPPPAAAPPPAEGPFIPIQNQGLETKQPPARNEAAAIPPTETAPPAADPSRAERAKRSWTQAAGQWAARHLLLAIGLPAGGTAAIAAGGAWWLGRRALRRRRAEPAPTVKDPQAWPFLTAEQLAMARLRQTAPSQLSTVKNFVRFRDVEFVPYETDSLTAADEKAMRAFADKYPGAVHVLETFRGMRDLFLKG